MSNSIYKHDDRYSMVQARYLPSPQTLWASEQTRAEVVAPSSLPGASFAERVKSIAPENLVFVDETGVSTKLTWLSARAPRGQPTGGSAPGHGRRLTVLGALARGGMVAVMTVAAATDWPVFQAFLQRVLIPGLRQHKPGATIVMDHLAAHRLPQARALLESAGFALLPLPRYAPDGTVKLGESGLGRRRVARVNGRECREGPLAIEPRSVRARPNRASQTLPERQGHRPRFARSG